MLSTLRVASIRPSDERARVAIAGSAPRNGSEAPSTPRSRAPSVWRTRPVAASHTTTFDHPATAANSLAVGREVRHGLRVFAHREMAPSFTAGGIPGEHAIAAGERVDPVTTGCDTYAPWTAARWASPGPLISCAVATSNSAGRRPWGLPRRPR